MNKRSLTGVVLGLAVLAVGVVGCSPPSAAGASIEADNVPDVHPSEIAAVVLDTSHEGWQATECASCHDLPVEGHENAQTEAQEPPSEGHEAFSACTCTACHGGNGACIPGSYGEDQSQQHTERAACTVCHEAMHGYPRREACVTCHFADAGTVECTEDNTTALR